MARKNRNPRVMEYDEDGKAKPGGKLLPDPFFLAVPISFCNQCGRVEKKCLCRERSREADAKETAPVRRDRTREGPRERVYQ